MPILGAGLGIFTGVLADLTGPLEDGNEEGAPRIQHHHSAQR